MSDSSASIPPELSGPFRVGPLEGAVVASSGMIEVELRLLLTVKLRSFDRVRPLLASSTRPLADLIERMKRSIPRSAAKVLDSRADEILETATDSIGTMVRDEISRGIKVHLRRMYDAEAQGLRIEIGAIRAREPEGNEIFIGPSAAKAEPAASEASRSVPDPPPPPPVLVDQPIEGIEADQTRTARPSVRAKSVPSPMPTHDPATRPAHPRDDAVPEAPSSPPVPVRLGAAAPQVARPGQSFTARLVAYPPDAERSVRGRLEALASASTAHMNVGRCSWSVGTTVVVRLTGDFLEVEEPAQEFVWTGAPSLVDFDVRVARDAPTWPTTLKYDVFVEGFRVAKLRLDLTVVEDDRKASTTTERHVEAFRRAFASYSSRDRARVLDRISALRNRVGLEVFLDCVSLRAGEDWATRIEEELRACDEFQLYWSRNAAQSEWVEREWRMALDMRGLDAFSVQPLEPQGVAPAPPEPLASLHFDDPLMYVRSSID